MSKAILGVLLLIAVVGGAIYWFETCPASYSDPAGYSVDLPHGWEPRAIEKGMMAANGLCYGHGYGNATAMMSPYRDGRATQWPEDGKQSFSVPIDWSQETEIAGSRAVLATFTDGALRCLGAAVDHGDRILVFRIGISPDAFEEFRPLFEKSARSIRFDK